MVHPVVHLVHTAPRNHVRVHTIALLEALCLVPGVILVILRVVAYERMKQMRKLNNANYI